MVIPLRLSAEGPAVPKRGVDAGLSAPSREEAEGMLAPPGAVEQTEALELGELGPVRLAPEGEASQSVLAMPSLVADGR